MQNIKIIKANCLHKQEVLNLLDEFRTYCFSIMSPKENIISETAIKSGSEIFDYVINSNKSEIFLAVSENVIIGVSTISLIPQIRKGCFYAEIEEMYIKESFQNKKVGNKLILECEKWAIKKEAKSIRLESGLDFRGAHSFYERMGFTNYGKAFEKVI